MRAKRLLVGGTAVLVVIVVGAGAWLAVSGGSSTDSSVLRALEADAATDLVPQGSTFVEAFSVAPCTDSDERARIVRVFNSTLPTASVLEDLQGSLEASGWHLVSTATTPQSQFAGEARYRKNIDGVEAELHVLSFIEDTPYTDQFGRPEDYNLEIDISTEAPGC